jgi:energy-coupling factor transporter ATP-binding protein EcfA2
LYHLLDILWTDTARLSECPANNNVEKIVSEGEARVRLSNFQVFGLFGEFNHDIPLNNEEQITGLIGPNGMGKTACLRLINALFHRHWSVFTGTEFKEIIYKFTDGSTVRISHIDDVDSATDTSDTLGLVFTTTIPGLDEAESWSPRPYDDQMTRQARVENYLPFLTRIGPKAWRVDSTRQTITFQEVIENYGDRLPEAIRRSLSAQPAAHLANIIDQIDCHLIETQRLLVLEPEEQRRASATANSSLAISRKAHVLRNIIASDLAQYASISQSLDRSFPRRVLLQQEAVHSPEELTRNLAELDKLRQGLTEAGILDPEEGDALPNVANPNPAIATVLNVYVNDTRQKLEVLAKLRSKILLFKELIDNRFKPKIISVDKDCGFLVKRTSVIEVPLDKLSSGEQHQLVLFFELLFELKSNALILIDEPELSLHVAWQRKFISDLLRIIELNQFDVLLATHSPQLIGAWDSMIVELGDVDPT